MTTETGKEGRNRDKKQKGNDGWILQLPEHIIIDILSRVRIETMLCCCKCVCKKFNELLNDPYFAEVHLAKAPNANRYLIIRNETIAYRFYLADLTDLDEISSRKNNDGCPSKPLFLKLSNYDQSNMGDSTIVGSCNGLICLYYKPLWPFKMVCVCNPILGEFKILPEPSADVMFFGFGFCPKTKQYKVIRSNSSSFTEIHTLGTNNWRNIGYIPQPFPFRLDSFDCSSLDGNFHWITDAHKICSFSFEIEQYSYIPPPPFISTDIKKNRWLNLGILGGLLCVSYLNENSHFISYVMKNYGVKESWTKEFSIDMRLNTRSPKLFKYTLDIESIQTLKLLNNGDMVIGYGGFSLLYYSPRNETVSDILDLSRGINDRDRWHGKYDVIDLVPSFISLKSVGGEIVEAVQRCKLLHNF